MNRSFFVICILFLVVLSVPAVPVSATRKIITETIDLAAKKSGKVLTPAMRKASEKALMRATRQYGDDVLKAVSRGGLEALEQGSKHGKLFWELCAHSPQAARSLALHADDLLPIARRIGPEFMTLEAHVPGMGKKAVECFGDDAVRLIANMPTEDAAKLIRYGAKADSPRTAKMLLDACKKTSGAILKHLDGKKIVALGLSGAMVTAAYKVSDGIEDGLVEIASESPREFTRVLSVPLTWLVACGTALLAWLCFPARRWLAARMASPASK